MALLMLIKPWAMRADSNKRLSKVLMEEPSKKASLANNSRSFQLLIGFQTGQIYLGDLRKALMAVSNILDGDAHEEVVNTNIIVRERSSVKVLVDVHVCSNY